MSGWILLVIIYIFTIPFGRGIAEVKWRLLTGRMHSRVLQTLLYPTFAARLLTGQPGQPHRPSVQHKRRFVLLHSLLWPFSIGWSLMSLVLQALLGIIAILGALCTNLVCVIVFSPILLLEFMEGSQTPQAKQGASPRP